MLIATAITTHLQPSTFTGSTDPSGSGGSGPGGGGLDGGPPGREGGTPGGRGGA